MSEPLSAPVEALPLHLAGKARALNALRGLVPAVIALPMILRVWAPSWFVLSWFCTYVTISLFFISSAHRKSTVWLEQAWSITISLMFCAFPISAVIWSGRAEDMWASILVCVVFIAFEMSTLPFLHIAEWRIGVLLVGLATTVCGMLTLNPVVMFMFAPLVLTMVHATDRVRALKDELVQNLAMAQQTIRHDPLTKLLNRRGLTQTLDGLEGEDITLALIDIDRFKFVNDTQGHQIGDQMLVALADELQSRLGDAFRIARVGGDEFVAVAPGHVDVDPSLTEPIVVTANVHGRNVELDCAFSIGVTSGVNVASAHRLLSEAGYAMRQAKRTGASLSLYADEVEDRLDRTLQIAAIASGDYESGRFVPVAQAIVTDDKIAGCELLIRWQQPDGKLILPAHFLSLAADAGLMPIVNDLMLDNAVRFAARFNNRPNAPFVSVNISAPHLGAANFCARVEALLAEYRVRPERLMIEITESEQLGNYGTWESAATELRSLGVLLAVDDFGSGYSSIERLHQLPITHMKFDRSLVQVVSGPFGEIVRGVARFAKAVNISIIAEGIETLDELESMRAFNISAFQGFYFHKPEALDLVEIKIIDSAARSFESWTSVG